MRKLAPLAMIAAATLVTLSAQQIDYAALWEKGIPFDQFLQSVKTREAQWTSRFANAAVEAAVLNDVRELKHRRRILAVAADSCSDSAWAIPYIAKLAAAVPERLELRIIGRTEGGRIQSAHLSPDGRMATPTVVVLDENNVPVGAWVERPAALQAWFMANRAQVTSAALHEHMDKWFAEDAGRTTLNEIVAVLQKSPPEGGK
jgi:hypothetical protein